MPIAPISLERNCRKLIRFAAPARHHVAGSEIRSLFDQLIRRAAQRRDELAPLCTTGKEHCES